ncbi:Short-chain dehydrogenase/reductase 3 [Caenorhabditis elegans]|uniref:Short-chain dehydrogenase/reductase 3 n=1 Tax=Caenorhabditis elegans TaxID=6239 RepID=O18030_CAEEL|nr:DeHydrogenases, Short chain [Caenorhabditis elegans]CAB04694.2 DeHydrogenases, Short chain [Caenorhabditis elegans]|eukprot:NP_492563.1 DeHydrogenases, Short chain [Caenorhabditis elegans]
MFDIILEIVILLFNLLIQNLISLIKYALPYSLLPKKDLYRKKVLITGAGNGLGKLLAQKFAARGATLILWDINLQSVDELKNEIRGNQGEAHSYEVNLCDPGKIAQVGQQVINDIGKVDILVNNAGIATAKMILDSSENEINRSFDVNVKAHFYTVQQFLPAMLKDNNGHIVTIASAAGKMGSSGLADYSSTKHAAVGFHDSLVAEIMESEKNGVKTTLVCPYYVHTSMFDATGAATRFPWIFPILDTDYVVQKIFEAIETEQEFLVTPRAFYLVFAGIQILPYKAQAMVAQFFGLVQNLERFHK